jgi:hypothetical protein
MSGENVYLHADPDTFLCSTLRNSPDRLSGKLKELLDCFAIWLHEENAVIVHIWRDILNRILNEYHGHFYLQDRGLEIEARKYLSRVLEKLLCIHEYGDHSCEAKITSKIDDDHSVFEDVDVRVEWEDFLASPTLSEVSGQVPVYSSSQYGVIKERVLLAEVTCPNGKGSNTSVERRFDVLCSPNELLTKLSVVDPKIVEQLTVDGDPTFVYEDTGHVPTARQRRIIERVARKSAMVLRAGTTYHNPSVGDQRCSISKRAKVNELSFQICDQGDLLGGIYITKAATGAEAAIAYRKLCRCLNDELTREGMS